MLGNTSTNTLGKTIYVQSGQALTSEFRTAPFWDSSSKTSSSADSYEYGAVQKSVPTILNNSLDNNSALSTVSIWAIAPFTDSAITGDIAKNIKSVLSCRWSFTFDITELEEYKSNAYPWKSSDCLLILGNIQSVSPKLFKGVQTYLNNGGRVIYWGNIAPDDETQFKLIGARRRSDLSDVCISALTTDMSEYTQGIRKFYPIEKVPRFTSLAPDCQILLQGECGSVNTPVAWTRNVNNGKLFYCSLSEESDWLCDDCHALMLNAIRWAFSG